MSYQCEAYELTEITGSKIRCIFQSGHTCRHSFDMPEAATPEPPPIPNDSQPIYEQVIADIKARAGMGKAKYGTYLQASNGRKSRMDQYQELLDAVCYAKQDLIEEDTWQRKCAAMTQKIEEARIYLLDWLVEDGHACGQVDKQLDAIRDAGDVK